jgi:hypothetical protein
MEQNGPWAAQGINCKAGIVSLLFDPYSELIVAHVNKLIAENFALKSLYARRPAEERYKLLTPASETLSYENVVLSPTGSAMFVSIFESFVGGGQDWHSLQKIELPSGKIISELKWGDLEPRVRNFYSPWIASIVRVDNDGETLYVRLAIPRENETKLRYYLAKLRPEKRQYEVITELSGGCL